MTRRYLLIRRAVRVAAALIAVTMFVLAMTGAAYVGESRRCGWLLAHDQVTAHTYGCEARR